MANKITDGNPLKPKPGVFIEEQRPQVLRFFGRGPTDHESLRTTGLDYKLEFTKLLRSVS